MTKNDLWWDEQKPYDGMKKTDTLRSGIEWSSRRKITSLNALDGNAVVSGKIDSL